MNQSPSDADPVTVYSLPESATSEDVKMGVPYLGTVNGVVPYGVFVDLSNNVSGLVHESALSREYSVGEQFPVKLDTIRKDGDMAFVPIETDEYTIVRPGDEGEESSKETSPKTESTAAGSATSAQAEADSIAIEALDDHVGDIVEVTGSVVQIKQTGGPTLFHLTDGTGIVPAASFADAGVRAHPAIERDHVIRVVGRVEPHHGALQLETQSLERLEEADEDAALSDIEATIEANADPASIDPLVEWDALASLIPDLESVATRLLEAAHWGRPIAIRHHADGDGISAAIPLEIALRRFFESYHYGNEASRHLLKRLPSKAPYYEFGDVTRDLNFALQNQERHGQPLPLLLMLDNGGTSEDVPAYESLAPYDVPVIVIDHHHPDTEEVSPLLEEFVNPYLNGEDYRITTGMLCVELTRMIDPQVGTQIEHVPAVAGVADRSKAEVMDDYLGLAAQHGYDHDQVTAIGDALDYTAHWLRYRAGESLMANVLGIEGEEERHRELVEFLASEADSAIETQLQAVLPHVEERTLENGATLATFDVDEDAHPNAYPAPGTTTGAVHDARIEKTDSPAITVGYGPDFAVLRSDGVRLDIPQMVTDLQEEFPGAGIAGGGHLVVGSIKFVKGKRSAVLDRVFEMMGDADIDESMTSASPLAERS